MNKGTIWTVLGVIVAIVLAFWIVNVLLSAFWLIFRLALVAVVAVLVYLGLRAAFSSRNG